jgi:hypothetical protein
MNCSRFETLVQDVARDCLAEEPVRAQLAEHAASCPGCARRLAAEQSLTAMFKVAASEKEEVVLVPEAYSPPGVRCAPADRDSVGCGLHPNKAFCRAGGKPVRNPENTSAADRHFPARRKGIRA